MPTRRPARPVLVPAALGTHGSPPGSAPTTPAHETQVACQGGSELRIGTRGSALALVQATIALDALAGLGVPARLTTVVTEGDRRAPDTAWGEGAFVGAIE